LAKLALGAPESELQVSSTPIPLVSVDLACNMVVLFTLFVGLLLSGLVFPDEESVVDFLSNNRRIDFLPSFFIPRFRVTVSALFPCI
jgi:hypothetical protein